MLNYALAHSPRRLSTVCLWALAAVVACAVADSVTVIEAGAEARAGAYETSQEKVRSGAYGAPQEMVQAAAAGGAVTAVAWDGDLVYAAVGTKVVAVRDDGGNPVVVAWSDSLSRAAESISADAGRVAVRLADASSGDIVILEMAGDRLVPVSTISGRDAGAPFHGLNLTGEGGRLLTVGAGELTLWDVTGTEGRELSTLPDVRGRPGSSSNAGAVGSAAGGLTTFSMTADSLQRQGTVVGPDVDEVALPAASRALGIARGAPPSGQVVSYDITDPSAAIETARLPLPAGAAFAALGTRGVSGQTSTGLVQAYEAPGPIPLPRGVITTHVPLAVAMAGELGVVGAAEGLFLIDAPDPDRPTLRAGPELGAGIANAVAWHDQMAYVAHGGGLSVFATDDAGLTPVGSAERPGPVGGLVRDLENGGRSVTAGQEGAVYVAAGESGLLTYDVSVPAAPTVAHQTSAATLGGAARAVSLDGWLYAATQSGIAWLDVANPVMPRLEGERALPDGATAISAVSGWMLVISAERLLVAPTGPSGPGTLTVHPEIERAQAVASAGPTAVVLSGSKLYVLSLASASPFPEVERVIELPDPGLAVAYGIAEGAWVGLADRVVRVDIGPAGGIVGESETSGEPVRALAVAGNDAIAAMGSIGVIRVHSTDPTPGPSRVLYLPRTVTTARASLR